MADPFRHTRGKPASPVVDAMAGGARPELWPGANRKAAASLAASHGLEVKDVLAVQQLLYEEDQRRHGYRRVRLNIFRVGDCLAWRKG